MVKPADPRKGNDRSAIIRRSLHFPAIRRVLSQGQVRAILLIIEDILCKQLPEVGFMPDDDMIEKLAAYRTDPSFADSVLPGFATAEGDQKTGYPDCANWPLGGSFHSRTISSSLMHRAAQLAMLPWKRAGGDCANWRLVPFHRPTIGSRPTRR